MARNPFQQLYVGEKVSPTEFVRIFSPRLVPHAMQLFQPGHVVLSGIQGSGKSMLFKLLQPAVRIAYADANVDFPLPADISRFVACGVNVNTARCNEFGNRRPAGNEHSHEMMFADFFNCLVALDLLESIEKIKSSQIVSDSLGMKFREQDRKELALRLSRDDVWSGFLNNSDGWVELLAGVKSRIAAYRRYLNFNDQELDLKVASTKTAIGEPVKAVVKHLEDLGIFPPDVAFFVIIDQYEELATIKHKSGEIVDYRSVVNRMLNSRESHVSYRVGTRGYAWRNHLSVFGTDARLEQERDFKLVELDQKLKRTEDSSTNLFPEFATDVFVRRLRESADAVIGGRTFSRVFEIFGHSVTPSEEARTLAGNRRDAVIKIEKEWPAEIGAFLIDLAVTDPLAAKLGEIWVRQKGWHDIALDKSGTASKPPWQQSSKKYWVKERTEMALLLIGGIRKQRAIFSGEEDILGLSSGNILVFLSICQNIWEYATQASENRDSYPEIPIKQNIQTIAIFHSARSWVDRIPSDYGRSTDRFKLVQLLGEKLSNLLYSDPKLSNPGQNGISFTIDEFRSRPDVASFLIEAVDYGNLIMSEHATRNKDRRRRIKFYLNPLYCPVYRIPFQRSKEPLYLSMHEFEQWLHQSGLIQETSNVRPRKSRDYNSDTPLFDLLGDLDD